MVERPAYPASRPDLLSRRLRWLISIPMENWISSLPIRAARPSAYSLEMEQEALVRHRLSPSRLPLGLLAVTDFNLDGKLDVAVAHNSLSTVSVLLGNGSGGFGVSSLTSAAGTNLVAVGDVNGDGKPDLVTGSSTTNNVSVQIGTGSGTFGTATGFSVGGPQSALAVE